MGGMQRVSMQLVRELKRKDDVVLKALTLHASWRWIGIKTFFFLVGLLWKIPRQARKFDADVILFSSMVTASLAWFIRSRVDIPMVTINHGQDVTLPVGIYQWFLPKVFSSLDGVISVSRATRQACIDRGMDPEKGVSLPNGFDLQRLDQFPNKESSRAFFGRKFSIPLENRYFLLTVGRQVKRKGHAWFIREVLPKIHSDALYLVIGDGPESENIAEAVRETGQQNRVFLLGRQPDKVLKQAYAAADLFIMPNIPVKGDMEGFGIVLLEANMARTPAIASDLEGIRDVIEQGKNGYRVPPENPDRFSEKVNQVLENGFSRLSDSARSYVQERFNWERVSEQYLDYLQNVIKDQRTYNPKI